MRFATPFLCNTLVTTLYSAPFVLADAQSYTLNIGNTFLGPLGLWRSTTVANGQFPGPLLKANKGDSMQVRNALLVRMGADYVPFLEHRLR